MSPSRFGPFKSRKPNGPAAAAAALGVVGASARNCGAASSGRAKGTGLIEVSAGDAPALTGVAGISSDGSAAGPIAGCGIESARTGTGMQTVATAHANPNVAPRVIPIVRRNRDAGPPR
jgi:hypothetical protein